MAAPRRHEASRSTEPPPDLEADEKWIDVDLEHQTLVAFEGKQPVYATLISSGRRNPWDPEHDRPTPTGTYRIHEKHVSATMDGDVASDGPYSIEDVPWVMYFSGQLRAPRSVLAQTLRPRREATAA